MRVRVEGGGIRVQELKIRTITGRRVIDNPSSSSRSYYIRLGYVCS